MAWWLQHASDKTGLLVSFSINMQQLQQKQKMHNSNKYLRCLNNLAFNTFQRRRGPCEGPMTPVLLSRYIRCTCVNVNVQNNMIVWSTILNDLVTDIDTNPLKSLDIHVWHIFKCPHKCPVSRSRRPVTHPSIKCHSFVRHLFWCNLMIIRWRWCRRGEIS